MQYHVKPIYSIIVATIFLLSSRTLLATEPPPLSRSDFVMTNVLVKNIKICHAGCNDVIPYAAFTVADTPAELCANVEFRFPLVNAWRGSSIETSKLFLSMATLSKSNQIKLQVRARIDYPPVDSSVNNWQIMPQLKKYCNAKIIDMGFDI